MGLYELQRSRENRSDWLFIIDMTLELGAKKCLVVLGISPARWQYLIKYAQGLLSYQEMELLALEVMSQSKGEAIYQVLEGVTERVGVPRQIISDHGSDLNKGRKLYQQAHPQVRVTYDVTHESARLLKGELELDQTYSTFAQQCASTRQQLQQTPLSFLMPPTQRAKARYFNVDSLLKGATKVLAYQQGQDFSLVDPCFCLDQKTLDVLAPHLDATTLRKLQSLKNQLYPNKEAFRSALQARRSPQKFSVLARELLQGADLGRRYFLKKLGWLQEDRTRLSPYTQMLALVRTLQSQLKQQGLTTKTKTNFLDQTSSWQLSSRLVAFKRKLLDYLDLQTAALPPEQSLLGSSDIIESLFGKYKLFSAKSPRLTYGPLDFDASPAQR